jgi:hypothetical protein
MQTKFLYFCERERKIEAHNLANKLLMFLLERERLKLTIWQPKFFYLFVSERERLKAHNVTKEDLVFFLFIREKNLKLTKMATLEAVVE